jgi:hypothetical protein
MQLAMTFPITPTQVTTYGATNIDTIDSDNNLLRLIVSENDVTRIQDRTAVVVDKLPGKRDLTYTFQPASWEITTFMGVEITQLFKELVTANPDGIPCKNYLEAFNSSFPFTEMKVKLQEVEEKGARTVIGGWGARPKGGYRLLFVRMDA